jgi:hypothetical protein
VQRGGERPVNVDQVPFVALSVRLFHQPAERKIPKCGMLAMMLERKLGGRGRGGRGGRGGVTRWTPVSRRRLWGQQQLEALKRTEGRWLSRQCEDDV